MDVLVGLSLDAPSGICQTRIMNREAIFTQELMQP